MFEPLAEFYEAIADDAGLALHISDLYMTLLQQWNVNGGINPKKYNLWKHYLFQMKVILKSG